MGDFTPSPGPVVIENLEEKCSFHLSNCRRNYVFRAKPDFPWSKKIKGMLREEVEGSEHVEV